MSLIERIADDLRVPAPTVRELVYTFIVAIVVVGAALAMVWLMFAAFGQPYPDTTA